MDAVGEEDALGVHQEILVLRRLFINSIGPKNGLQRMADAQILLAVLVPEDVAAPLGGLGQMECVLLLLQRQVLPSGNLVTHHLEVSERVNGILEIGSGFAIAAGQGSGHTCHHHHFY